ncbi:MAG TPA: prepilin peptidase [Candidatus Tyrphobacter sp.]
MISSAHIVAFALAGTACGIAAGTDLVSRRVPNALTLPLLVAAPLLAAFDGVHAALVATGIVAGALVLGTLVHAAGVLGGGDVKLLAGAGALAGFPACIDVALYSALCGGVLAIAVSAARGELAGVAMRVRFGVTGAIAGRSLSAAVAAVDARGARIPYAVAIGAGFAIAMLAQSAIPVLRIVH